MKTLKRMTLLELMDHVSEKAERCRLSPLSRMKYSRCLNELATRLGLPPSQALLLSVCLRIGPRRVDVDDLAEFLSVSSIRIRMYADDIGSLVRARYLRYESPSHDVFDIPDAVVEVLGRNQTPEAPRRSGLSVTELFAKVDELFKTFDEGGSVGTGLVEELNTLLTENKDLPFVKVLEEMNLPSPSNRMVMVALSNFHFSRKQEEIEFSQLRGVFGTLLTFLREKNEMQNGEHYLIKEGLVEHEGKDKGGETAKIHFTEKAKKMLLPGYRSKNAEKPLEGLTAPESLVEKELYYTERNARQVEELATLLKPDNYDKVVGRLVAHQFGKGFTCLLYGPAGTGKTETVKQLARSTGRGIMQVNIPEIKSKWVGESQKNMKAVFDRYKSIAANVRQVPILLFNEADGIFGVRLKGASEEVEKMEGAIQAILLQELEDFEGILIATTNLSENLDKAFERRFLYKIRFDKPDAKVRAKIWRKMIPSLDEEQSAAIAESYDFSGGQIANVAKKHVINSILHDGCEDIMEALTSYCNSELLEEETRPRIGF